MLLCKTAIVSILLDIITVIVVFLRQLERNFIQGEKYLSGPDCSKLKGNATLVIIMFYQKELYKP